MVDQEIGLRARTTADDDLLDAGQGVDVAAVMYLPVRAIERDGRSRTVARRNVRARSAIELIAADTTIGGIVAASGRDRGDSCGRETFECHESNTVGGFTRQASNRVPLHGPEFGFIRQRAISI